MGAETVLSKRLINLLGEAGLPERLRKEDLEIGLTKANELITSVRDLKVVRVQGIGDDFIPDTLNYNALGAIYPVLSRELRNHALSAFLQQLDNVNHIRVQDNHTPYIREPIALTDIGIVRPRYWPGLDEGKELATKYTSFEELKKELIGPDGLFDPKKVRSDFCVAYALLRSDMSKFGNEFRDSCNQTFLERVVRGIVNLRFGRITEENKIAEGHKRLKELLPKNLHPLIESFYKERDWPDLSKFK